MVKYFARREEIRQRVQGYLKALQVDTTIDQHTPLALYDLYKLFEWLYEEGERAKIGKDKLEISLREEMAHMEDELRFLGSELWEDVRQARLDYLRLTHVLREIGIPTCGTCGHMFDQGDIAWNEGSTEFGTPYSVIEVICQKCGAEGLRKEAWNFNLESLREVLDELEHSFP